ncbi:3-isopropylmalate dehydratase small subunit [Alkalicoccus chagannorensis]|uniref:3-isopropylmalate dehydratase small subunit n=1 Tax=Alkalicoccus chagannorensis TaxID=427072 RepID=UPI00042738DA|nr:3-isopropylmalate dehydratase small subunit [Alkalicoccus chagannorensis]
MREYFEKVHSHAAPLDAESVDTDTIVPKQFLKWVTRTGYGDIIFYDWRYDQEGREKDFILNQSPARDAEILLTKKNFGSGSSREHAPWGLKEFGFSVIIAPSFAEIFYQNSIKNGILPVTLSEKEVDHLFSLTVADPHAELTVDLDLNMVKASDGTIYYFEIDRFFKDMLLHGLDDIGLSLQHEADITQFETEHRVYYQPPSS